MLQKSSSIAPPPLPCRRPYVDPVDGGVRQGVDGGVCHGGDQGGGLRLLGRWVDTCGGGSYCRCQGKYVDQDQEWQDHPGVQAMSKVRDF